MKKKMSVFLAIVIAASMLLACGAKDTDAVERGADNDSIMSENIIESVPESKESKESKEPVEKVIGWQGLYNEWVLGSDIEVGWYPIDDYPDNLLESLADADTLAKVPELKILLPVPKGTQETSGGGIYEFFVPETEACIKLTVALTNTVDKSSSTSGAPLYERVEYGRYYVDVYSHENLAGNNSIWVQDFEAGMTYIINFNGVSQDIEKWNLSKDDSESYAVFFHDNIEFIKEQVESWEGSTEPIVVKEAPAYSDFDSVEGTTDNILDDSTKEMTEDIIDDAEVMENDSTDSSDLLECDIIPCGKYKLDEIRSATVGTYDDNDSGECMLTFSIEDAVNNDYRYFGDYYDIDTTSDTYTATNTSTGQSVTIIFTDDGMDLSGGTGELEEFCGHYTLEVMN